MHHHTLSQLAQGLAQNQYSSVELTQHFLARIKRHNPLLNAFISINEDQALSAANFADQQRREGTASALTGIPLAHKDIFCTEGIKTSCASKMLDNFIAPYDATVVRQLKSAGMIMLGKTNMDEFAMGSSNENSFYGAVKNPWHTAYVPGGSSGGSAAAVAARLVPAATGTDTGGSIRQPAALCGITGLKPTYGSISRLGMIAFASSLDQAGILAYTAEDVAMLLNAMIAHDPQDSTSVKHPISDFTLTLNESIRGLRIGLPKQFFADGLDPAVQSAIRDALTVFEKLGATLHDIDLPHSDASVPAYYIVAPAECSANLARYDGVRFGYRCDNPRNLTDLYERSRGEGFGQEVKRRIMIGTYVLSAGYYDAYYLKAQKIRRLIRQDFVEAFKKVDVIMGPTSPTTAFALGTKTSNPVSMYLSDIYTIAVNLAGLPGMSIPAGFIQGLPVGLQLISNYFDETRLLNAAHQYQQITDWHHQCPTQFK